MRSLIDASETEIHSALRAWAEQAPSDRAAAIVLGGSVNGLSFVRSLARRGVATLMLDSEPLIGTQTRHGRVLLLPPVERHPDLWLGALSDAARRLAIPPVLFFTSDVHGVFVTEHSTQLADAVRFIAPNAATMESIVNKRRQYAAAQNAGIPIPRTLFPQSTDDVREVAHNLPYPCILKPYKSHLGRQRTPKKVVVVSSEEELLPAYSRIVAPGIDFMVQEIIPGDDDQLYGYLGLWDGDGHELCGLTKRKLRQNPPHYGDGSLQITVDAPEVAELSRRLLAPLRYRGFVGVEFKFDARDRTYRLMEINPRTVSGNQIAISAGMDFPWIGYCHLTGADSMASALSFRRAVRYVNEEWDFKAFLALRRERTLTFREWVRSLRGAEAFAVGAWDDPGPLLAVMWRFLRGALRRGVAR